MYEDAPWWSGGTTYQRPSGEWTTRYLATVSLGRHGMAPPSLASRRLNLEKPNLLPSRQSC